MAQHKDTTELTGLLFQWMGLADPMLGMLEWLCAQMMEAEVSSQLGAQKHEQRPIRLASGLRTEISSQYCRKAGKITKATHD